MISKAPAMAATAAAPATKFEVIRRKCGQPTPSQMKAAHSLSQNGRLAQLESYDCDGLNWYAASRHNVRSAGNSPAQ